MAGDGWMLVIRRGGKLVEERPVASIQDGRAEYRKSGQTVEIRSADQHEQVKAAAAEFGEVSR